MEGVNFEAGSKTQARRRPAAGCRDALRLGLWEETHGAGDAGALHDVPEAISSQNGAEAMTAALSNPSTEAAGSANALESSNERSANCSTRQTRQLTP